MLKRDEYNYKQFYKEIKDFEGLSESFKCYLTDEDFVQMLFEVCGKVAYIGVNAPKWRMPNSTEVQGSFQYVDIDCAIENIIGFVRRYQDIEVDEVLNVIGSLHQLAISGSDTPGKTCILWNIDYTIGSYYIFSELPRDVWKDISKYAKQCICENISPDSANSVLFKN